MAHQIIRVLLAWFSIFNIVLALFGNTVTFVTFRFNKDLKKHSYSLYLSICAITDTVSLFVWNLNQFMELYFNISVESKTIFRCRLFSFTQYVSLESSAWLLSIMCIDRFFIAISMPGSFVSKLPFGTTKAAFGWSSAVIILIMLFNVDIFFLNGFYDSPVDKNLTETMYINNTLVNIAQKILIYIDNNNCYEAIPGVYVPVSWETLETYLYSFIPFLIMLVFNILLIYKTLVPKKSIGTQTKEKLKSLNEKRKTTLSLLTITFAFIVMTLPSCVLYGYFGFLASDTIGDLVLKFSDFLSFLNRSTLFINCFITNKKFRNIIILNTRRLFCIYFGKKGNSESAIKLSNI